MIISDLCLPSALPNLNICPWLTSHNRADQWQSVLIVFVQSNGGDISVSETWPASRRQMFSGIAWQRSVLINGTCDRQTTTGYALGPERVKKSNQGFFFGIDVTLWLVKGNLVVFKPSHQLHHAVADGYGLVRQLSPELRTSMVICRSKYRLTSSFNPGLHLAV